MKETDIDWNKRIAALRETEWRLHKRVVEIAEKLLDRLDPLTLEKLSPDLCLKFANAASELGRLAASGMKSEPPPDTKPGEFVEELHAAIERVAKSTEGMEAQP